MRRVDKDACVTHDVVNEESGQGCLCDTRCCAGMKNMKVTDESEFMRGKRGECACTLVLCVMLHVCLHVFTIVSVYVCMHACMYTVSICIILNVCVYLFLYFYTCCVCALYVCIFENMIQIFK